MTRAVPVASARWQGDPLDLAVLRIAVAGVLLLSADVRGATVAAEQLAALPAEALAVPLGSGGLIDAIGVRPGLARAAQIGIYVGAFLGLIGRFTRPGFALVTVSGLYLLAIPHLRGSVVHYHHLLWFSALLAASPCDHALSLGRRSTASASAAYGLPLRIAWALIAVIFFFPGAWKLIGGGADWLSGDTLRAHLYWKWVQSPALVAPRIDRVPGLLAIGAAAVSLLELGMPLLVLSRRGRWLALGDALGFHALTAALMDIHFSSLWPLYVVFVPWAALLGRERAPEHTSSDVRPRLLPAALTGGALLLGAGLTGVAGQTQGWPFACYPTFHQHPGWEMPGLWVTVLDPDGSERPVPIAATGWGEQWRLAGIGGPVSEAALAAYWSRIAERDEVRSLAVGAESVRFYRAAISVLPDDRGQPPLRLTALATLPTGGSPEP